MTMQLKLQTIVIIRMMRAMAVAKEGKTRRTIRSKKVAKTPVVRLAVLATNCHCAVLEC